ncbi:VOC family protein [Agrococcus sp. SGAir0287]|uniref:VOC family protein n=1 Tax=Agrococcus sp. SGAir0287 TaxID=2070347 RepID=UPI0010CD0875|nr:VOC family protein [Agrococcus sp. SGAir0287]QCR19737.1 bleomycin resistance protein [Agrococcus sp. SGAir0287]
MRIRLTSVFVDDQDAARTFYTETLGFAVKHDVPLGDDAWLTLVEPGDVDGIELLLEPSSHPAVAPYRDALREDGIPSLVLHVDDLAAEHARLAAAGVVFTQPPVDAGTVHVAVFDDTCGNLVQLLQPKG